MATDVRDLVRAAASGELLGREEGLFLAEEAPFDELVCGANEIRRSRRGDVVSLCAIANARSGACPEDCAYCAQSAHWGTDAPVYPMRPRDELVSAARCAEAALADAFCIVCSGRGPEGGDFRELVERARAVREVLSIELHVSAGELSRAQVRELRSCGVTSVNHNLETSERFFPSVCSTHSWADRARTVELLREERLEPCSGGIFGMGETWADRVDLALALRGLGVRRVPVNFLNPRPGTPLAGRSVLAPREALRILAVLRFLLPDAEIRTCGGRSLALGPLESWMFHAGASATMIGDYLTTKGRPPAEDVAMLDALGLEPRARLRGRGPRATHDASPSGVPEERPGEPLRRDR